MVRTNAQRIATRRANPLRRRGFSVLHPPEKLLDGRAGPFAALSEHHDHRRGGSTRRAQPDMTAVVGHGHETLNPLHDVLVGIGNDPPMRMGARCRAEASSPRARRSSLFDEKRLAAVLALPIDPAHRVEFFMQFDVTVGADQFKSFGELFDFFGISRARLAFASIDVMEMQGALTSVISASGARASELDA